MLEAMGVAVEMVHWEEWWLLIVRRADLPVAAAELDAYRQERDAYRPENASGSIGRRAVVPLYGGAMVGVATYVGAISLISILAVQRAFDLDWLSVGRMHSGSVMAGQWSRIVTALTLHLDAAHLFANLLFGAVFGYLTGRILGGGVAWLGIVTAGALGNLMNAAVQPPNHSSIGASTAVFAALGLLVSHSLRPRGAVDTAPLRRWSPLVGGCLLLALTGVGGERTDVIAHLTGFTAGLGIGWGGCRLPSRWLASNSIQTSAGLATIVIVAVAWIVGVMTAS